MSYPIKPSPALVYRARAMLSHISGINPEESISVFMCPGEPDATQERIDGWTMSAAEVLVAFAFASGLITVLDDAGHPDNIGSGDIYEFEDRDGLSWGLTSPPPFNEN